MYSRKLMRQSFRVIRLSRHSFCLVGLNYPSCPAATSAEAAYDKPTSRFNLDLFGITSVINSASTVTPPPSACRYRKPVSSDKMLYFPLAARPCLPGGG